MEEVALVAQRQTPAEKNSFSCHLGSRTRLFARGEANPLVLLEDSGQPAIMRFSTPLACMPLALHLSKELAGIPPRPPAPTHEAVGCMQHPLTLHSACDICADRRCLRLLFSLLPPDYEANSEDT